MATPPPPQHHNNGAGSSNGDGNGTTQGTGSSPDPSGDIARLAPALTSFITSDAFLCNLITAVAGKADELRLPSSGRQPDAGPSGSQPLPLPAVNHSLAPASQDQPQPSPRPTQAPQPSLRLTLVPYPPSRCPRQAAPLHLNWNQPSRHTRSRRCRAPQVSAQPKSGARKTAATTRTRTPCPRQRSAPP